MMITAVPWLCVVLAASGPTGKDVVELGLQPVTLAKQVKSGALALPVNVLVSAEADDLQGALSARGWEPLSPDDAGPPLALEGKPATLALHSSRCNDGERPTVWLWELPVQARALPLWAGTVALTDCREDTEECLPPRTSSDALSGLLTDFLYAIEQTRQVGWRGSAVKNLPWVELARGLNRGPSSALSCAPSQRLYEHEDAFPPLPPVEPQVVTHVDNGARRIALTFDACSTLDGARFDAKVIETLARKKVPATLFVSGRWAQTHPAELAELAKNPLFEIANHSYVHPHMTQVPVERQRAELLWTQRILQELTGKAPRYFRPPFVEADQTLVNEAASLGLVTVMYDLASGDADKAIPEQRLKDWVVSRARSGSVVVMHMNGRGWHTAEILPQVIDALRAKGLVLSTMSELLAARSDAVSQAQRTSSIIPASATSSVPSSDDPQGRANPRPRPLGHPKAAP